MIFLVKHFFNRINDHDQNDTKISFSYKNAVALSNFASNLPIKKMNLLEQGQLSQQLFSNSIPLLY